MKITFVKMGKFPVEETGKRAIKISGIASKYGNMMIGKLGNKMNFKELEEKTYSMLLSEQEQGKQLELHNKL
jgi:hypothetical protein